MTATIRLATAGDAAAIAEIYRPIVASTFISFEIDPPNEAEMRRRIEETLRGWPWLVYESDGQIAGYAYASRHRARLAYQWSVDTSAYVHADFLRRGFGRCVYEPLFRILAAQGYRNAYAGIALPNPASVGLHEACGFTPVGVYRNVGFKLGEWRDVGWWQLTLSSSTEPPQPPRTLEAVQRDPSWPAMLAGISKTPSSPRS
jgi:L-amino acid N-acyltransferase YncA